ncbi:MAG: DNA adenine methylase [Peptoniphilus harei]|nr:DNA adenine methylase [Peptoniphilus harei]
MDLISKAILNSKTQQFIKDEDFSYKVQNLNQRISDYKVKPFLKWAGGKGQLLKEIEKQYPFYDNNIKKYVEPFVGGGAVFFDILNKYDLESIYISDTNDDLINAYRTIKYNSLELIELLKIMENEYLDKDKVQRKQYYLEKRQIFNDLKIKKSNEFNILKASYLIFLNRTCFNGLYRVNSKGLFNVPMGSYKNPQICDEKNIIAISNKLKRVEIKCADFKDSEDFIDENTFVYFDPPYRPITKTANFTAYTSNEFNDNNQIELANFVKKIDKKGAKFVLSNSDPKNTDEEDNFFDNLYSEFKIRRVDAKRMINSDSKKRGNVKELLISNF